MKIQGSLELILKPGDYNPLLQQIHPLNQKSNDKHGKSDAINNTRKKKLQRTEVEILPQSMNVLEQK